MRVCPSPKTHPARLTTGRCSRDTRLGAPLSATGDATAASHPWLERDPATGACSLRLTLPPPQIARRLADALSAALSTQLNCRRALAGEPATAPRG